MTERYKLNEANDHAYYKMPKELFVNEKYKALCLEAKTLYGLLLDRMELSRKNNWYNDEGEIYLIFPREEVEEILCLADKTVTKAFRELNECGLIEEIRQGMSKPNIIYIKHLERENLDTIKNRKFYDSRTVNFTIQESYFLRPNKTDINKTDINNSSSSNSSSASNAPEPPGKDDEEEFSLTLLEPIGERLFKSKEPAILRAIREATEGFPIKAEYVRECVKRLNPVKIKSNPLAYLKKVYASAVTAVIGEQEKRERQKVISFPVEQQPEQTPPAAITDPKLKKQMESLGTKLDKNKKSATAANDEHPKK